VLCAGSALLLVEDESTSVVNGALVGVLLSQSASPSVVLSALLLTDKPWFLTEGKDLPLCSSYFPLRVSQLSGHNHHQLHASHQSCPPACPLSSRSLFPDALFRFRRSHYFGHGETAVVIARSWWRELVGGECGGVRWSVGGVVFLGVRRNPYRKADTDAVTLMGAAIPS
jgi:hypothetical protein